LDSSSKEPQFSQRKQDFEKSFWGKIDLILKSKNKKASIIWRNQKKRQKKIEKNALDVWPLQKSILFLVF